MTVLGYTFLFLFKSEAVDLCKECGQADTEPLICHSAVFWSGKRLTVRLRKRKNRPGGSFLHRPCACAASKTLCLVHRLEGAWRRAGPGERLFKLTYEQWLRKLRQFLSLLGKPRPQAFCSHALRRGGATDVWEATKSVAAVLNAGEWYSPAFLRYLKSEVVDEEAFIAAVADLSGDE